MSTPNGIRIPLAVNSGMLIGALIAVITLWVQQGTMAEDIQEIKGSPVTEARIVAIELNLKHLTDAVEKMSDVHEANTRDILEAIENAN